MWLASFGLQACVFSAAVGAIIRGTEPLALHVVSLLWAVLFGPYCWRKIVKATRPAPDAKLDRVLRNARAVAETDWARGSSKGEWLAEALDDYEGKKR